VRARTVYAARPPGFRIPGGTAGVWINALVPAATWALVLGITWQDGLLRMKLALLFAPAILYAVLRLARGRSAG
jgi:hypothetical protein